MADQIDRANELAEQYRAAALAKRKPIPAVKGIGLCLNCGAETAEGRRWCDAACRDDWDRERGG